ncbi:MAG TPA: hypothetical protein VGL71_08875 [Urbifossiella sp.]
MSTVEVVYDGKAFVPTTAVDLPKSVRSTLTIPASARNQRIGSPPPPVTKEHLRLWDEIIREIETSEPHYPNMAEAMKALRGEP